MDDDVRLRAGRPRDMRPMHRLLTDPRVRTHLGGPRPPTPAALLAVATACLSGRRQWVYVVADTTTDRMLGTVTVARRPPGRPGHVREGGRELELSYVLLPEAWGRGVATRACRELLRRVAAQVGEQEPVIVVTQSSNRQALALAQRLGFTATGTEFCEFGQAQTLLSRSAGAIAP